MISFHAILKKFEEKGEKSGWTYIDVPAPLAHELNPEVKTSYRVKGLLDKNPIHQVALVPMGEGNYIMAINASMRKAIKKREGAQITVSIELDQSELIVSQDLLQCLEDEPIALKHFQSLTPGHQRYFSNWIEDAKTVQTKTKRISQALLGLTLGMDYGQMIRHFKNKAQ